MYVKCHFAKCIFSYNIAEQFNVEVTCCVCTFIDKHYSVFIAIRAIN